MLSCRDISKLVSESLDRKLSWWDRLRLGMHLGMCSVCRGFQKTVVRIRQTTQQYAEQLDEDSVDPQTALSDEARERIQRAVNSRLS